MPVQEEPPVEAVSLDIDEIPVLDEAPLELPAEQLPRETPPQDTSPQALQVAIDRLPVDIREGVQEALKGRFVGLIPAMVPLESTTTAASEEMPPEEIVEETD